jgi:hypothetical protein
MEMRTRNLYRVRTFQRLLNQPTSAPTESMINKFPYALDALNSFRVAIAHNELTCVNCQPFLTVMHVA